jgi:UDP:flavonoid glycosyltransferase YjiC (YdhE family)
MSTRQTRPVRLLFTFAGGAGHLNPLLPIATAAAARGHAVALTGKPSVVALAERDGFTVFGTGTENDAVRTERGPLEPVDREREDRVLRDSFAGEIARRRLTELLQVAAEWQPDALVCDETDFGGTCAAERLGLPHATMLVNASGSFVRPELLAGTFDVSLLERYLVLNPFPTGFRNPAFPLPATAHGVRLHEPRRRVDGATVYFSLGTIFDLESGDLFERVLAALGTLPVEAVATIGRRLDPRRLGPVPSNVRVERYVPQDEILAACDLVVSHGGSGSLLGALTYGLPVVVLPLGADQPGNADRCVATGIGRVLDAATASPSEIAEAVADVLADPSYAAAARRLQAELATFAPPSEVVSLIEERLVP